MARINLLEEGAEGARGRKKSHEWERKPKVGRLLGDKDLLSEIKSQEASRADVLHIRNRLPSGPNSKDVARGKGVPKNFPKGQKPAVETGSISKADAGGPLPEESDAEKLARLEARIQSDEFSDAERKFFKLMVEKYPYELQAAKEKIEKRGGAVDGEWAAVVRTSYINDRKRAGLDKERWEPKIPLAPEKADLFEEYLLLKLPVGIPEEVINNNKPMKEIPLNNRGRSKSETRKGQEKKTEFSPEQQRELDDFCAVIKEEYDERFLSGNFRENTFLWEVKEAFRLFFQEDCVREGIFSKKDEDAATKLILERVKEIIKI